MLFENIEDEDKKDQKFNGLEKSVIFAAKSLVKIVLWKVGKARTYGDLMKLGNFIEDKMSYLETKYPDEKIKNEASVGIALYEIQETEKEIKVL